MSLGIGAGVAFERIGTSLLAQRIGVPRSRDLLLMLLRLVVSDPQGSALVLVSPEFRTRMHAARPENRSPSTSSRWKSNAALRSAYLLLWYHAKRSIGARNDDVVGLDQALGKADRGAGLDDVALDCEPLPDLGGADEIDRKSDRNQR
jgi:hypothetical protein